MKNLSDPALYLGLLFLIISGGEAIFDFQIAGITPNGFWKGALGLFLFAIAWAVKDRGKSGGP